MRRKHPPTLLLVTTFVASFALADSAFAGNKANDKRPELLELRFSTSAKPARAPAMVVPIPSRGSRTFGTRVTAPVHMPDGVTRRCEATLDREPDSHELELRLECGPPQHPQVAVRGRFRPNRGRPIVLAGFAVPGEGVAIELAARVR